MTENEAINGLKILFSEYELDLPCTDSLEISHIAIQALEEVQQYRAIGTIDQCSKAMEKMKPVKVKRFKKQHEVLYQCGACGRDVFSNNDKYCAICGQAISWEV